jgi:acetyl esterase/lipase
LPKGKADFPAVLFVHGGAWLFGDRRFFGAHEGVGETFARHGVGAAVASYRLSPAVRHPEHVKDVARAFAWLHQNVKKYGGRPDRLFVCGHSAGGHLAALLATDERYLEAEGLSLKDVRGAMPISGVYSLPGNLFQEAFGTDAEVRKKAGPRNQVRAGCPPFLIVYADQDFPFCDFGSEDFCKALKAKKVEARTVKVVGRNHVGVLTRIPREGDPCARALLDFVAARCGR